MAVSETQDCCCESDLPQPKKQTLREEEPYVYTSIRYDPSLKNSKENTAASFNIPCPFYMLEHHWTRLQVANWSAQFWPMALKSQPQERPGDFLRGLLCSVKHWQQTHPQEALKNLPLRLKKRVYPNRGATTEITQLQIKPQRVLFPESFNLLPEEAKKTEWTVILDCRPTEPSEATMFKTWDRSLHSRARADAGILAEGVSQEVLLFNSNYEILDGSMSTPYFRRNGAWVTPISSSGGLQGTTRRWALEKGLCTEAVILMDSFEEGEIVWCSNSVYGFFWAVYQTRDPALRSPPSPEFRDVLQHHS